MIKYCTWVGSIEEKKKLEAKKIVTKSIKLVTFLCRKEGPKVYLFCSSNKKFLLFQKLANFPMFRPLQRGDL
jgi:hypothetical protein